MKEENYFSVCGNHMKTLTAIALLVIVLLSCSAHEQVKADKFPKDEKLLESWTSFKAALNKSDFTTLKLMSQDCINALEADTVIPKERFYNDYFSNVFNAKLLSYINDSIKVSAGYDRSNVLEMYSCLSTNTGLQYPKLASIQIGIPIPNQKEGLSVMLDFIETKAGYKFCGYYNIP